MSILRHVSHSFRNKLNFLNGALIKLGVLIFYYKVFRGYMRNSKLLINQTKPRLLQSIYTLQEFTLIAH
jgi:hypothetical protein